MSKWGRVILFGVIFLLCSCTNGTPEKIVVNQKERRLSRNPHLERDTTTFAYFKSKFVHTTLPLRIPAGFVSSGTAFMQEDTNRRWEDYFLSCDLTERWLISPSDTSSELALWYDEFKPFFNDREWNWYSLHAGYYFQKDEMDYFLVYRYHQVSAINGSNWTYFLMTFDQEHALVCTQTLIEDKYFTWTETEDTEEQYFWQRLNEYGNSSFQINEFGKIDIKSTYYYQIEGDVLDHQEIQISQANVSYDSINGLVRIDSIVQKNTSLFQIE